MVRPSDDDIIEDDEDDNYCYDRTETDGIGVPLTGRVARVPDKTKSNKPSDNKGTDKSAHVDFNNKIKPVTPPIDQILEKFTSEITAGLRTEMQHMEDTMVKLLQPQSRPNNYGSRPPPTCYGCGATGHYRNNCPQQQQQSTWGNNQRNPSNNSSRTQNVSSTQASPQAPTNRPPPTCYGCGVVGHTRNRCPQQQSPVNGQQSQARPNNVTSNTVTPSTSNVQPLGN